jgi:hypothetical protein
MFASPEGGHGEGIVSKWLFNVRISVQSDEASCAIHPISRIAAYTVGLARNSSVIFVVDKSVDLRIGRLRFVTYSRNWIRAFHIRESPRFASPEGGHGEGIVSKWLFKPSVSFPLYFFQPQNCA